jgi:hypothetical protein
MGDYDILKITALLARLGVHLRSLCFRLRFRVGPLYDWDALGAPTPPGKAQEILSLAHLNHEVGRVTFELAQFWIDDFHGNPEVLIEGGVVEQLGRYCEELRAKGGRDEAERVQSWVRVYLEVEVGRSVMRPSDRAADGPAGTFAHGYALLVGVDAYLSDRITQLPACASDVKAIRDVLVDPYRCGYLPEQVRALTGPASTRDAILDGLKWLAARAAEDPDATAIFYYSGHGWKNERSTPPRYYLLPYETAWDGVEATALDAESLTERLRPIAARRLVVILDACHAGGATKDGPALDMPAGYAKRGAPADDLFRWLGGGGGKVVMASSQEDQFSYAGPTRSVFTAALTEALSGGLSSGDGPTIGVLETFVYLAERVPRILAKEGYKDPSTRTAARQTPVMSADKTTNFPIAMRRAAP